jgi:hypothetical protein
MQVKEIKDIKIEKRIQIVIVFRWNDLTQTENPKEFQENNWN